MGANGKWYHNEPKPDNCWIREIDHHTDLGYINIAACEEAEARDDRA